MIWMILGVVAWLAIVTTIIRSAWRASNWKPIPPERYCEHCRAVEVESGDAIVAWLCPDCDAQLPASFREERAPMRQADITTTRPIAAYPLCPDCEYEEVKAFGSPEVFGYLRTRACFAHFCESIEVPR
jgi:hypothetical protein